MIGLKVAFGVVVIIIVVFIGVTFAPVVNDSVQGEITADGASWNSEVLAAVSAYLIFFLMAIGFVCLLTIFAIRKN